MEDTQNISEEAYLTNDTIESIFHDESNESEEEITEDAFVTKIVQPDEKQDFIEARKSELKGLLKRGTFKIVDESSIPQGTGIFG